MVAVVVVLGPNTVKEVLGVDRLPQIRAILGRHHFEPLWRIGRRIHLAILPPPLILRYRITIAFGAPRFAGLGMLKIQRLLSSHASARSMLTRWSGPSSATRAVPQRGAPQWS